jgi:hypothetical protein
VATCASDAVFAKLTQQLTRDRDGVIACVGARAVQFALTLPDGGHKVYVMDFTSKDDPRVVRAPIDLQRERRGNVLPSYMPPPPPVLTLT